MRRPHPLALLSTLILSACGPGPANTDDLARIEDRREIRSEALVRALDDADAPRRGRAARAMGRIQSMEHADALARATNDGSPAVRIEALFALGQLGLARGAEPVPVALEAARAAATDGDSTIRALAVEALGKLASLADQERLRTALDDPSPEVRAEAAHALFRLRFVPTWRGSTDEPPALEEASTAALIRALEDDSAPVRRLAAHALSRYGEVAAQTGLVRSLDDPDEWTRLFAARGLGRAGDAAAVDPLSEHLDDTSARVRTEVVASIGRLGRADRLPESVFSDPSFHVRAAAAASAPVDASLDDPSPTVVAAALGSPGWRTDGGTPSRDAVLSYLADPRWPVRAAAVRALAGIGDGALPALERAADDASPAVRLAAFETRFAVDRRIESLEPGLESQDLALRGTALALLEELAPDDERQRLERLLDASPGEAWVEIREAVVDRLGAFPEAAGRLRRVADEDLEGSVRVRARQALERLGEPAPAVEGEPGPASAWLGVRFESDPVVEIETSKGTLVIRCLAEVAPIHVASFLERVEEGFYDGLSWHRVVPNFVVQGGDPRGDGWGGAGYLLRDEISRERYDRGTVGMPKAGKDTGGGQLFITHVPTPHLDGNYTVFGRVIGGDEVIDRLEVGDTIVRAAVRRE